MKVLVACEESQTVCKAFRAKGHEAYSCDIQPCGGGCPEWHIQGDVLEQLNKGWDLMIAHPPCTYFCLSGIRWMNHPKHQDRKQKQDEAVVFVEALWNAPIAKMAIENPVGVIPKLTKLGKYSQIIQPYEFGDKASKKTCLWLKNLPLLIPTNIVDGRMARVAGLGQSKDRWKKRSRTLTGIAEAMANQWGKLTPVQGNLF